MTPRLIFMDPKGTIPRPVPPPKKAVFCLGSFDGVHIAHASLLRDGMKMAATLSGRGDRVQCGVFCFWRPSMDYIPAKDTLGGVPTHLTTLKEKLARMGEIGVDFVCLCDFSEIQSMNAAEFIRLLETRCGCIATVCGYNFRFGAGAEGSAETLQAHFKDLSLVLPPFVLGDEVVCSSLIRQHLLNGNVETANLLLGYPYSLTATVVHGKGLGRKIGFPTANQYFPTERLIPRHGVYAVLCHTPFGTLPGVSNIGDHPTVDHGAQVNCETYVAGFSGNLYGRIMTVELYRYLRPERKFDSLDDLIAAIHKDAEIAVSVLPSV